MTGRIPASTLASGLGAGLLRVQEKHPTTSAVTTALLPRLTKVMILDRLLVASVRTTLLFLAIETSVSAVEMEITRDLPYANQESESQKLDVYFAEGEKRRPIVIWIHGGGWRQGDKGPHSASPRPSSIEGSCSFQSIIDCFRTRRQQRWQMNVAKAVRWIHDHADEFSGDPESIFVTGHSAGAHLAALVCTDER